MQVPDNLNRLPENFPDESLFLIPGFERLTEEEKLKRRIKMSSIYKIWNEISLAWKLNV